MTTRILSLIAIASAAYGAGADVPSDLLKRTGRSVETFWNQFAAVTCLETVDQAKLGKDGKVVYRQESEFDYLIVLQLAGDDLVVDESRVPVKQADSGKNLPLLITNGFATLQLVFHPLFQSAFEYSAPEAVQVGGHPLLRVRFRHLRGSRSPSVLRLKQREYPLDWRGEALIDPQTASIVEIHAGLDQSMDDVGLKTLTADVHYDRVEFQEDPGAHFLPVVATIEAETVLQHWRNIHTFSNYRQFSVDVKTSLEEPK